MPTKKRKLRELEAEGKKKNQSKLNFEKRRTDQTEDEASVSEPTVEIPPDHSQLNESSLLPDQQPLNQPSTDHLPEQISQEQPLVELPSPDQPPTAQLQREISLIDKPFHPDSHYQFKKGHRNRSCSSRWFTDSPPNGFPWLHYRSESDTVICYLCHNNFNKGNLIAVPKINQAFISTGFSTWGKAVDKFKEHQVSECHRVSLTYEIEISQLPNIMDVISSDAAEKRIKERKYLAKLIECVRFLGRQGIALQGNHDDNDNLTQLMIFHCNSEERERVLAKNRDMERKKMSHADFQNELLDLMAREVLLKLLVEVKKSKFYAIMADEGTDVSNKELLSLCLRYIDGEKMQAFEEFFGFYEIPNIASATVVNAIKDSLIRFNLSLEVLRGQTYDGASNMLGKKTGVATRIKELQPKALDTHCHGHSLNLAVKGMTNECKLLNDTKGTVGEICILVKYSPKRDNMLGDIKKNIEMEGGNTDEQSCETLAKFSITRWTVRSGCYKKVIDSYDSLYELWTLSLNEGKMESEIKGRIIGCQKQMETFKFYYGLHISHKLYALTDDLSVALQSKKRSAVSGQRLARLTIKTIEGMRDDKSAANLFQYVVKRAERHEMICEPNTGRRRKQPKYSILNYIDGLPPGASNHHPESAEDMYRGLYFEVIDFLLQQLNDRFESDTYVAYAKMETVLLTSLNAEEVCSESLEFIRESYSDDIDVDSLSIELQVFKQMCGEIEAVCFDDILEVVAPQVDERGLIPNVQILMELIMVNPATSATPERSFSLSRRLKTWQRSTMKQQRFNSLAILHEHKAITDKIDLVKVANAFVDKYDERLRTYGRFTEKDFKKE